MDKYTDYPLPGAKKSTKHFLKEIAKYFSFREGAVCMKEDSQKRNTFLITAKSAKTEGVLNRFLSSETEYAQFRQFNNFFIDGGLTLCSF